MALSDDKTLTSANIPWIFRLPQGTDAASALRMLMTAEARVGADPEKVRDLLSSGQPVAGLAFLPSGELIR